MKSSVEQEVDKYVNGKWDVPEQTKRFQEAQSTLDFTTMYEVLFQTACQYIKKKQGKYWDWNKIVDVANDITITIMERYKKNPNYHIEKHASAIFYAYLGYVGYTLYKQERNDNNTVSWDEHEMERYLH